MWGTVHNYQAQTTYFDYIILKKFISKVFRGNPTLFKNISNIKIYDVCLALEFVVCFFFECLNQDE